MTDPTARGPAPDDGTLVRYLDGELSPGEARAVEEAAGADPAVRARLDHLRALSESATGSLDELEVPALPPLAVRSGGGPRPGWGWRRAAAVVLLGGGLLVAAVPGLRAGFMEGARQVAAWVAGARGTADAPAMTRVAFPVSGSAFQVVFERPAQGRLTLGRASGDQAEARVVQGSVALRVEPDGLRVLTEEGWTEVEVRVPDAVEEVLLRIPGQEPRTVSLAALEGVGSGTLRIPLSDP